jgi:hypothetical protein
VPSLVRLPITQYVRYGALEVMAVDPADPARVNPNQARYASIEYQTGLWDKIDLIDGRHASGDERHVETIVGRRTRGTKGHLASGSTSPRVRGMR